MKIHYIIKGIITTTLLFFILTNVAFAQPAPSAATLHNLQLKKEIVKDKIILSFPNIIGETQSDFQRFESKVNQAGFLGLIDVKIDLKSNKMTAVFKKDTTEENFLSFFRAVGYNSFQFIR
jgi:hypothetical protein